MNNSLIILQDMNESLLVRLTKQIQNLTGLELEVEREELLGTTAPRDIILFLSHAFRINIDSYCQKYRLPLPRCEVI